MLYLYNLLVPSISRPCLPNYSPSPLIFPLTFITQYSASVNLFRFIIYVRKHWKECESLKAYVSLFSCLMHYLFLKSTVKNIRKHSVVLWTFDHWTTSKQRYDILNLWSMNHAETNLWSMIKISYSKDDGITILSCDHIEPCLKSQLIIEWWPKCIDYKWIIQICGHCNSSQTK